MLGSKSHIRIFQNLTFGKASIFSAMIGKYFFKTTTDGTTVHTGVCLAPYGDWLSR